MNKAKIGRRLLTIVLVFAVPFTGLAIWLLAEGINDTITFAQQEIRGNAVQRPLESLLLAGGRMIFSSKNSSAQALGKTGASVNDAFQEVAAALGEHGAALQFTDKGLASRHRENLALSAVRQRWQAATAKGASPEAIASLMADARGLIAHGGDTSNLILDPDLDSYYVMDVTLCVMPELQERIANSTAHFVPLLKAKSIDAAVIRDAAVQVALLRDVNVARIDGDLQTALTEDANFYGSSPSLTTNLTAAQKSWHVAVDAYIDQLNRMSAGDSTVTAESLDAAGFAAHQASFAFWRTAVEELDQLLNIRIAAKVTDRRNGLLTLAILIIIASVITWRIARNLNAELRRVCVGLTASSTELKSAAEIVSSSSTGLADDTNRQAASLEEISATLEEISSMSRTNVESVQRTKELADGMRSAAEAGSNDITRMSDAMAAIQTSSNNIAQIIKTIDEIAFQTNILALNAAVEAARAGEAGAGFAVVAEEVRSLAQRAASAARETTQRIEDSIGKSRDGVTITQKVTASFADITAKAREVNKLVAQISTASDEQYQGVQQASQAICELDKSTQNNAASAEETATVAAQLDTHVDQLDQAVSGLTTLIEDSRPAGDGPVRSHVTAGQKKTSAAKLGASSKKRARSEKEESVAV